MIINKKLYREIRCSGCRKLLGFEYIFAGRLYFDCPRCGKPNSYNFKHMKTESVNEDLEQFKVDVEGGE